MVHACLKLMALMRQLGTQARLLLTFAALNNRAAMHAVDCFCVCMVGYCGVKPQRYGCAVAAGAGINWARSCGNRVLGGLPSVTSALLKLLTGMHELRRSGRLMTCIFPHAQVTPAELAAMIKEVDVDGNGQFRTSRLILVPWLSMDFFYTNDTCQAGCTHMLSVVLGCVSPLRASVLYNFYTSRERKLHITLRCMLRLCVCLSMPANNAPGILSSRLAGLISLSEFVLFMSYKWMDADGSGRIVFAELKHASKKVRQE